MITVLDSQGPTTYHSSRAAAAVDIVHRLGAELPRSLNGAEIVKVLTRHSALWILTKTGREVSADWQKLD